jgi:hypothetical protein
MDTATGRSFFFTTLRKFGPFELLELLDTDEPNAVLFCECETVVSPRHGSLWTIGLDQFANDSDAR